MKVNINNIIINNINNNSNSNSIIINVCNIMI